MPKRYSLWNGSILTAHGTSTAGRSYRAELRSVALGIAPRNIGRALAYSASIRTCIRVYLSDLLSCVMYFVLDNVQ